MRTVTLATSMTTALLMGSAAAPVSLVQNEYDFAATVARLGIRDGFLQYLDRQAISLSPTPVNDYDKYSKAKPGDGSSKLFWYPAYAILASSGDFGVDTGPWDYEAKGKDGKTVQAHGEWLTVWHLDKDGHWKALFDSGIGHDVPSTEKVLPHDAYVAQMKPLASPAPSVDVHDQLTQAESAFSTEASSHSLRQAYENFGSVDLRLLLEKSPPILGRDLAAQTAPDLASKLSWEPMGGSTAESGDLGHVYGETYKLTDAKRAMPVGVYMHVWRREADGWKLLIALQQPL